MLKRSPTTVGSAQEKQAEVTARQTFDEVWRDGDDDDGPLDPEMDELLVWWNGPRSKHGNSKESLRLETDDFYEQLVALYAQYRMTHPATTLDHRSIGATEGKLKVEAGIAAIANA